MAFSPNWINPNNTQGASGAYQHWVMMDAGSGTYYALLDHGDSQLHLYRSTDDTATWSLINSVCPINILSSYVLGTQLIGGIIRVVSAQSASQSSGIVQFSEYNIAGNAWTAVSNIGGALPQTQQTGFGAAQDAAGLVQFKRQDGSRIVIYQSAGATPGYAEFSVLKETGGVWTLLRKFSGATEYFVFYAAGLNPVTDRIYGFHNYVTETEPSGYNTTSMMGFVVDTDDTVTNQFLIEGGPNYEELMPFNDPHYGLTGAQPIDSSENGRVAFPPDGLTVAFGWGFWTNAYINGDIATVGVHTGIGDLSGDPLNPTWLAEEVANFTPKRWNNGFSNDVNVSFEDEPVIYLEAFGTIGITTSVWCGAAHHTGGGAGLKCYWGSRVTAGSNNTSKLFWSLRTAPNTWAAKAILFPDPDRDTIHLDGFDVPPAASSAPPPPITSIACPTTTHFTVGVPYFGQLEATGGTPPYTWAITSGSLPGGVTLDAATGIISGIPTVTGDFTYTAEATDSLGATRSATCPLLQCTGQRSLL